MPQHDAIEHLETFGYCLIEDAIPALQADAMAEKYFQLHRNPANRDAFQDPNDEMYQTLFGVVNLDEMCWECIAHPQVLQVVRHFLGDNARLGERVQNGSNRMHRKAVSILIQHTTCQRVSPKPHG